MRKPTAANPVIYTIKLTADFEDKTEIVLCEMIFEAKDGHVDVIQHIPDTELISQIMERGMTVARHTHEQEIRESKRH